MWFRSSKPKPADTKETPDGFLPVLSAPELIRAYELSQPLAAIRNLVAVTDKHFELYYQGPIYEYLTLTQFLGKEPVCQRFSTVIKGLKLRRPLLLPTGVESESIRQSKDLWTYVTFVALLLYNIGPSVLGRIVVIKDSPGDRTPAKRWHPLLSQVKPPQVYRIVGEEDATPYSTAYFLQRIFPNHCLHWIMQDSKAFNTALELIVGPNPDSLLGALLLKAFNLDPTTEIPRHIVKDAVAQGEENKACSQEQSASPGEAFYDWLKNRIQTPSSSSSESCCFNSSHGLTLVCPDIFKQYAAAHSVAWKAVQNDFLRLKRHTPNTKNNSDYHMLMIPGRGNVNTLIIPELSLVARKP
jgi:hypothetical protein